MNNTTSLQSISAYVEVVLYIKIRVAWLQHGFLGFI